MAGRAGGRVRTGLSVSELSGGRIDYYDYLFLSIAMRHWAKRKYNFTQREAVIRLLPGNPLYLYFMSVCVSAIYPVSKNGRRQFDVSDQNQ
jgi:hypothetical protein